MFKRNICLILSLIYLILEILIGFLSLKTDFSNNGFSVLVFILLDLVTPVLLYYFYFNSEYSKIVAFLLPFFTSAFAWCLSVFFYHIRTNFVYYGNLGLGTGFYLDIFCVIHMVSAVVFTVLSLTVKSKSSIK